MGISGTDLAITVARVGILRAGAGRSGWPVLQGARAQRYALSGVARAGATRSNFHSPKVFVTIAGTHYATGRPVTASKILDGSMTITDSLDHTPNVAAFVANGFKPIKGQLVIVTLGSKNNREREFAGPILRVTQSYTGTPLNPKYAVSAIDFTWGLNKRKVTGYYTGSASTIAASLISTYAAGYTADNVQAGLDTVDGGITFTNEDLTDALTRLAKRIGAYWYVDYYEDLHFFVGAEAGITEPTLINAVHPSLLSFESSDDLSQVITRVTVTGGGGEALEAIAIGETILPVSTADWYPSDGGTVEAGPQHIAYTGLDAGGGGGLVGPGAAPSSVIMLALASGSGVESGTHDYATTFVTAAGESLPGPVASITVGVVAAPAAAPTAGTPTIGTGPDPGTHDYAVTLVTSAGETTASPLATRATTVTPAPTTAPTPGTATVGGSVDPGLHDYAVSHVTAIGETTPSPISGAVSTYVTAAPSAIGSASSVDASGAIVGSRDYAVTFVTSGVESPVSAAITGTVAGIFGTGNVVDQYTGGGSMTPLSMYQWATTLVTARGETAAVNADEIFMNSATATALRWTFSTDGSSRVTARRHYRSKAGETSPLYFVEEFAQGYNDPFYLDDDSDAVIQMNATIPAVNTAEGGRIALAGIPTGPSGTTARKIYRTASGGGALKLLATIADNVTTTYDDGADDSTLGADASSGGVFQTVPLSGIPIGDANVTSRKLYRRSGGAGLKLLATIADNSTTTYTDTTANASLGAAPLAVSTAYLQRIPLTAIPVGGALVTARRIYRTAAGGSQLKLAHTLADNTTTTWTDTVTDAGLGVNVPVANTAAANQVALSGIPVGGAAVTSRKLYRSAAAASQLKLLATIADNTSSTYNDSTADGSLGANAPVVDASGLGQPEGQVPAGSTSIVVAGTGPFRSAGGWAIIGNGDQLVRYTGKTGSTLTGIPASGVGSIVAAIGYNSTITTAPCLIGIPSSGPESILYTIPKGEAVNIYVTVDDEDAQAALAALIGGDGIQEEHLSDNRLARAEATARGRTLLDQHSDPEVVLAYTVRDINTRAGRTASVNLGGLTDVRGDFKIQSVTMSDFTPELNPIYTVQASTTKYSFEDLLRQSQKAGE